MRTLILFAVLLLAACQPVPDVLVVEITPRPPDGIYRERIDLTDGFTLSSGFGGGEFQTEPADSEFMPDFWRHTYTIPEQLVGTDDIWIEVVLDQQALYVHRGEQLMAGFRVSTGRPGKDTPPGLYQIYAMYTSYPMWGPMVDGRPAWHYPDVPYAMFYHGEFAIHGAYWHDDFGMPVSAGCVNMNPHDARWVYGNVTRGTYVLVR